jgi:rhamnulokinase
MATKKYLIFDFGASNGRAIVAKFDGARAEMEVTHRFDNRPVTAAGTFYWDILRLFSELKIGLQASLKKHPDVVSLAVDTWGCDFGFIDKKGKLLANPVTYRDRKRHERSRLLYEIIPKKELFMLSAGSTIEIMGIYQLFSFKYDDSSEIACGSKFLMMPDLLDYFITGRPCNEYTNATMALLCDQTRRTWEKKILQRLGIDDSILCDIVMPGERIGRVQEQVCRELDVAPLPVITPATHDTASAVTGMPAVEKGKNWAFISTGTWSISGMETAKPVLTEEAFDSGYGNNGIAEGRNMLVKYITGLWIIQQCREKWMKERGSAIEWDEVVRLSEEAGPATAVIDVDTPVFGQPQADMPGVIVSYCREKGQKLENSIGPVARCVYESLALKYRHNLQILEKLAGKKLDVIHLVGGGIQNRTLCQWTSDAMGVPVSAGPVETTSLGSLLMQLKGSGEIASLEQGREIALRSSEVVRYEPKGKSRWDDAYGKYRGLFP